MLQPAKKCGLARTFLAIAQLRDDTEITRAQNACDVSHIGHQAQAWKSLLLFFWLPNASNLTTMLAKCKFLQQVGDVFPRRHEAHLDLAVRTYRSDASEQSQGIGDAIAQVDFEHALVAERREWRDPLPHAAQCIETNRSSTRTGATGDEQRADHVEQQVHFHF